MSVRSETATRHPERDWWRRTATVLWRPGETFLALADDSPRAVGARQEPLTAIVFLSGVSIFLSTRTAGTLFDERAFDPLVLVVEAILAGLLVGLQNFWIVGGCLYLGALGNGTTTTYRQARHLVGYSLVPFVLALVTVWPVRLAVFGSDLFSSGGSDTGAAGEAFRALDAIFLAWSLGLLFYAVRILNDWSWVRSVAALALAAVFVTLFVALAVVA